MNARPWSGDPGKLALGRREGFVSMYCSAMTSRVSSCQSAMQGKRLRQSTHGARAPATRQVAAQASSVTTEDTIAVVGASGNVGRLVALRLADKVRKTATEFVCGVKKRAEMRASKLSIPCWCFTGLSRKSSCERSTEGT